jgi:hypothetical protein
MTGRFYLNTGNNTCCWMICICVLMAAFNADATTVDYTLDNVVLADGKQMTGTFDWTYNVGDFEGGTGIFSALDIPHTPYSFAAGNLNIDIQTGAIEISGNGNFHDMGLDITLRLPQPLSPTQSAPIDTDPNNPNQSFFECCGNGFHDQPFQSGRIIPSAFLVGDFDVDGDTDGADFLKWQRGEVSNPLNASDLTAGKQTTALRWLQPRPQRLSREQRFCCCWE